MDDDNNNYYNNDKELFKYCSNAKASTHNQSPKLVRNIYPSKLKISNSSSKIFESPFSNKNISPVIIKVKQRQNTNSILSKFRSELDKNNTFIDEEVQKSMEVKKRYERFKKNKKKKEKELYESQLEELRSSNEISGGNLSDNEFMKSETELFKTALSNVNRSNDKNSHLEMSSPNVSHSKQRASVEKKNENLNHLSSIHDKESDKITKMSKQKNFNFNKISSPIFKNDHENNFLNYFRKDEIIRKSNFRVNYLHNWYDKTGLPPKFFTSPLMQTVEYQSPIIIDEMKVIMDNLQFFKINFLGNLEMINIFRNMSSNLQTKYNKYLEETCGLLMKIPNIVLLDFSQYLEKFVAIRPPDEIKFKSKNIRNEEKHFIYLCRLFNEVNLFLKSVVEVYNILSKQVDDMVISKNNFNQVMQFLSRSRYNISYLITTAKNAFINMKSDIRTFLKYQNSMKKDVTSFNVLNPNASRRKPPLPKINKSKKSQSERPEKSNKFNGELTHSKRHDDFMEKISRLNILLSNKESDLNDSIENKKRLKKISEHESALNSSMMTKLLKYCPKDIREAILSQRIIDRYREKNSDNHFNRKDDEDD